MFDLSKYLRLKSIFNYHDLNQYKSIIKKVLDKWDYDNNFKDIKIRFDKNKLMFVTKFKCIYKVYKNDDFKEKELIESIAHIMWNLNGKINFFAISDPLGFSNVHIENGEFFK